MEWETLRICLIVLLMRVHSSVSQGIPRPHYLANTFFNRSPQSSVKNVAQPVAHPVSPLSNPLQNIHAGNSLKISPYLQETSLHPIGFPTPLQHATPFIQPNPHSLGRINHFNIPHPRPLASNNPLVKSLPPLLLQPRVPSLTLSDISRSPLPIENSPRFLRGPDRHQHFLNPLQRRPLTIPPSGNFQVSQLSKTQTIPLANQLPPASPVLSQLAQTQPSPLPTTASVSAPLSTIGSSSRPFVFFGNRKSVPSSTQQVKNTPVLKLPRENSPFFVNQNQPLENVRLGLRPQPNIGSFSTFSEQSLPQDNSASITLPKFSPAVNNIDQIGGVIEVDNFELPQGRSTNEQLVIQEGDSVREPESTNLDNWNEDNSISQESGFIDLSPKGRLTSLPPPKLSTIGPSTPAVPQKNSLFPEDSQSSNIQIGEIPTSTISPFNVQVNPKLIDNQQFTGTSEMSQSRNLPLSQVQTESQILSTPITQFEANAPGNIFNIQEAVPQETNSEVQNSLGQQDDLASLDNTNNIPIRDSFRQDIDELPQFPARIPTESFPFSEQQARIDNEDLNKNAPINPEQIMQRDRTPRFRQKISIPNMGKCQMVEKKECHTESKVVCKEDVRVEATSECKLEEQQECTETFSTSYEPACFQDVLRHCDKSCPPGLSGCSPGCAEVLGAQSCQRVKVRIPLSQCKPVQKQVCQPVQVQVPFQSCKDVPEEVCELVPQRVCSGDVEQLN